MRGGARCSPLLLAGMLPFAPAQAFGPSLARCPGASDAGIGQRRRRLDGVEGSGWSTGCARRGYGAGCEHRARRALGRWPHRGGWPSLPAQLVAAKPAVIFTSGPQATQGGAGGRLMLPSWPCSAMPWIGLSPGRRLTGVQGAAAGDLPVAAKRPRRWPAGGHGASFAAILSATRRPRGAHSGRREGRRPADRATHQVRAGHQPDDRQGAGHHVPAFTAAACRRGDSVSKGARCLAVCRGPAMRRWHAAARRRARSIALEPSAQRMDGASAGP